VAAGSANRREQSRQNRHQHGNTSNPVPDFQSALGFRLIKDRLNYRRRIPWRTSKREIKRGRDITWNLQAVPAPEWAMDQ